MRQKSDEPIKEQVIHFYESHKKIQSKLMDGTRMRWRIALVVLTQLMYYGVPWLSYNGRQAVLFDIEQRRFFLGPLILYPQDLIYLTALLIICALGLFLFTAVAGRLWCGYACPQTVYTQMFMWLENAIEGERSKRLALDKHPWSVRTLVRRTGKHISWLVLATWTGVTFVGYFTDLRTLMSQLVSFQLGPWQWFWVILYSVATYANAGFMREQVCKYMCPYARFQSAMFDKDSLIVTYDAKRGEPRGVLHKQESEAQTKSGACIDCKLCVQVCPVGIDIRKGLQYECISCGACIDACDFVMEKIQRPKGLIRFTSQNALDYGWSNRQILKRIVRKRVLIYTGLLLGLTLSSGWALYERPLVRINVMKDRTLAREVGNGWIENVYQMHMVSASEQTQTVHVSVQSLSEALGSVQLNGPSSVQMDPLGIKTYTYAVRTLRGQSVGSYPIEFVIKGRSYAGEYEKKITSSVIVPR